MPRRTSAAMLVVLLAGTPLFGQTASLGVITQSSGGRLNNAGAAVGTTLFNGDRLSTDSNGTLGLRSGAVQLALPGDSAVLVNQDGPNLVAVLQQGSVAFTVESGGAFRLSAADVRVRPQSTALTAGQVTLENCAVVVTSRVQALEVTAGKETKIVSEGQSYRVSIAGACENRSSRTPLSPAHSRFFLIPFIAGGISIWAVHEVFESPDRP